MLRRIQEQISALYDLPVATRVDDFVCDEDVARAAVGDAVERGEVLMVAEEDDGISVGLYVDRRALERLAGEGDPWLCARRFDACCLATEGVSHFVYLVFRAENADDVSALELELQAEVDKYATGLLAGDDGDLRARSRALRHRLFAQARFLDAEGTELGERYRIAHRLAAGYAASLEARWVRSGRMGDLATELRRFYRLGLREKVAVAGAGLARSAIRR